ncbi:protein kinase domain-containing protein [Herpetosiphon llansteffanensis]
MESFEHTQLGEYALQDEIGRGGMALVYRAHHPDYGSVAFKVLPPYFAHDTDTLRRFMLEARAIRELHHPHIVQLYEASDIPDPNNTRQRIHYIAMEFIGGSTLSERLQKQPRQQLNPTIEMGLHIGSALDYAHRKQFIHRDIKPSNILFRHDGHAVLADFGIALVSNEARMTKTGGFAGTVAYTAPEIAEGQSADARSDIYALGLILYEALAGKNPYANMHANIAVALSKIISTPLPPLRELAPHVPPLMAQIIERATAKDPERRFENMSDFVEALKQAKFGRTATKPDVPLNVHGKPMIPIARPGGSRNERSSEGDSTSTRVFNPVVGAASAANVPLSQPNQPMAGPASAANMAMPAEGAQIYAPPAASGPNSRINQPLSGANQPLPNGQHSQVNASLPNDGTQIYAPEAVGAPSGVNMALGSESTQMYAPVSGVNQPLSGVNQPLTGQNPMRGPSSRPNRTVNARPIEVARPATAFNQSLNPSSEPNLNFAGTGSVALNRPNNKKKALIAGIGGGILGLVLIGVYILSGSNAANSTTGTGTPNSVQVNTNGGATATTDSTSQGTPVGTQPIGIVDPGAPTSTLAPTPENSPTPEPSNTPEATATSNAVVATNRPQQTQQSQPTARPRATNTPVPQATEVPPTNTPAPVDSDGDGFTDDVDGCPGVAGPNNGCPAPTEPPPPTAIPDSDGDTIPDNVDSCPNEPGDPSRGGCPKPPPTNTPRPTAAPTAPPINP